MPNVRALPTLRRRRLGEALRTYRAQAGLSLDQAAEQMGGSWDGPKLSRIENAKARINAKEVEALLGHYGVAEPETVAALEGLARDAGKTGWWSNYSEVAPQRLQDLISSQSDAESIRQYQPTVIPGLLQIGSYAREITAASAFDLPPDQHAAIAELRIARQAILTRPGNPVKYWVVLHESLLLQRFASHPSLMREQLRHLLDMADLPNITLQVMPLTAGAHPGASGNFTITRFQHPWPTLISIESRADMRHQEGDPAEEKAFMEAFDRIVAAALPADQSREAIRKHMEGHSS
ncbi:helix-turn-helix domain-containing protein [Streptacidiphilus sp. N1-12]|uniref:Helix-turn-helix domain-containing protein n=2 Tax=Streptacidiphilus alkalitolerans TaxID=3342712 RepID=A0ABV6WG90_9ACTN